MPKAKQKRSDYGDACATMRSEIRMAIADTSHITGMRAGDASEALVESMFAKLHDKSIAWALREIIDRQ